MKHLFSCLKAYRKEAILAPLFKLCEAVMELLVPLVVAQIMDIGIAGGKDEALLFIRGQRVRMLKENIVDQFIDEIYKL